ncbi:hypothetical protein SISNIDRAFT_549998 [Sistotremastrum niveocremeum HHB9708]|uniref:Signal recognition particle receptor subunit beta n=1 Tax=Sistotremastrum niveocremeum HHB9708 TaxID=1314777 RepID=A0A164U6X5_9AGAM|nr:hypothetical protein SISNIDRAFT_549998 [Sistotremastrum niveocremeum HHB9708]
MASPTPDVISIAAPLSLSSSLIAATAFVLALIAVYVYTRLKSRVKASDILILGASDAGKTAILSSLVYDHALPTHTSLQTNFSVVALPNAKRPWRVVDVPGHPRMRDQFREFLPQAKAVVFVVDVSTVARNGLLVAEHLHQVLHAITSLPPTQPTPLLLLLAHKSDLLTSSATSTAPQVAVTRLTTILERELEKRRVSQANGVGVEGLGEEESEEMGGLECAGAGPFKFAEWDGGEVTIIGSWVDVDRSDKSINEKEKVGTEIQSGLQDLRSWIEQLS